MQADGNLFIIIFVSKSLNIKIIFLFFSLFYILFFHILFKVVPLDWWPVSRDCLAYGVTVAILICIIHDERVEWYEALTLVLLYIVYIAVMYWDKSFQRCTRFRTKNSVSSSEADHIGPGK